LDPVNFFVAQVRSGQSCLVWVLKFSPKNTKYLIFFQKSSWVKGGLASNLLQVKSMHGSGQGPSLPFKSSSLKAHCIEIFLWSFFCGLPRWEPNLCCWDRITASNLITIVIPPGLQKLQAKLFPAKNHIILQLKKIG